ncbi:MAG: hypothetical protein HYU98_03560 [Deltaproteobacteria bacterium]|nr:hypothetical protein [Deltaproteobacteria bacterium]
MSFLNGISGFGGSFFNSGFSVFGSSSGSGPDVYGGLIRAGTAILGGLGGMPSLSLFGDYYDALVRWRLSRVKDSDDASSKKLPQGTDSKDPAERGVSYLREHIANGNKLPPQSDVIRNILGKVPEDEAEKAKYKGEQERLRKQDNALRILVEKIIGEWIKDIGDRNAFVKRWKNARNDAERIMALIDPNGDGKYVGLLTELIPGLQSYKDDSDRMWEEIADWFNNNIGMDAIKAMGDETLSLASYKGLSSETPISESDKDKYFGKIKDRGYTDDEAASIMSAIRTKEEMEDLLHMLVHKQQENLAEKYDSEIDELKDTLNRAQKDEDKAALRAKIERTKSLRAKAIEERAKLFLRDLAESPLFHLRYGRTLAELEYSPQSGRLPENVKDVPTAVEWVYGRFGRNVVLPKERAESDDNGGQAARPKKAGGGKAIQAPTEPAAEADGQQQLSFNPNDVQNLLAYGYLEGDLALLQQLESDVSNIPRRTEFNEWLVKKAGFENFDEVESWLGRKYEQTRVEWRNAFNERSGSIKGIDSLISEAANFRQAVTEQTR